MTSSKSTKRALISSALAILMCVAMLIGTTFAWFTDTASTGVNKIVSGNLKVDIIGADSEDHVDTLKFTKAAGAENEELLWEPGCRYLTEGFRIANKGNLALKWKAEINKDNITDGKVEGSTIAKDGKSLLDVIDFYVVTSTAENAEAVAIEDFVGNLKAGEKSSEVYYIKGVMQTTAGNDYQDLTLEGITITVYATQDTVENDSFGNTYDENAEWPVVVTTEPGKNRNEDKNLWMDATKTTYTYSISSAEALKAFAQMVTDTPAPFPNEIAYNAILTKDIDMTNVDWGQVSIAAKHYVYVTIDGNGHTIKNLNVTGENTAALFTSVGCEYNGSAKVMNLTVKDSTFKATGDGDLVMAGVFQAKTGGYCNFYNCHVVNCKVESTKYGGGFIGYDACGKTYTLKNCSVKETKVISTADAEKSVSMGGFIGYTQTPMTFDNCVVSDNTVNTGKYHGNYVGTVNADCTFIGCKVGDSALTATAGNTNFGRILSTVTVE